MFVSEKKNGPETARAESQRAANQKKPSRMGARREDATISRFWYRPKGGRPVRRGLAAGLSTKGSRFCLVPELRGRVFQNICEGTQACGVSRVFRRGRALIQGRRHLLQFRHLALVHVRGFRRFDTLPESSDLVRRQCFGTG